MAKLEVSGKPITAQNFTGALARPRGAQKERDILLWTLRWGYTEPGTIQHLFGIGRSAARTALQKLVVKGLLVPVTATHVAVRLYHLTAGGVAHIESERQRDDVLLRPVVHPSRLSLGCVQHDILVQRIAAQWVTKWNGGKAFSTRQIATLGKKLCTSRSDLATKIPDALLQRPMYFDDPNGEARTAALEVQQSWERKETVEQRAWQIYQSWLDGEIHEVVYASTRQALLHWYRNIFAGPLRPYSYWAPDHKWRPTRAGTKLMDPVEVAADWMEFCQFELLSPELAAGIYTARRLDDNHETFRT